MSFFVSSAYAQSGAGPQGSDPMVTLLLIGGMFLFMYLFIIRPQRKRQKEHSALVSALSKGDEVVLTSGMLGKVIKVDDNYVVLETGNGIELKFQKVAVHAVLPKGTLKSVDGLKD
ncbi:preprotein translocase subunit YajC [Cellvibrio polysaccharolyticus]|uniref:Sec translocon accessory complex subunit YajC n=1 Tax=Cellvibrio polysaccharolyticus TaxID=2082724 RepID=A0A928V4J7_9GAMM|nr:preprotein translocase subunit YajC [Cellvibrio polysaccharolyticus]MBE8717738.1 preprotein translocase subunit YajC [Cellvibrio polysaccharolyticus]